ncbi:hypothetical protein SBA4_5020010 [Candidatus Sulfopaludibacter sp. SbA4]|nr:hypothetical protein SBA4_5020010 [Candidatus Sulfopaludibacter sp. SbA4]
MGGRGPGPGVGGQDGARRTQTQEVTEVEVAYVTTVTVMATGADSTVPASLAFPLLPAPLGFCGLRHACVGTRDPEHLWRL